MRNLRLPLAYLGAIGYYQKIFQAESICLEMTEHYVKQSLRNRMYILGPNGVQTLIIPVKKINGNKTAMRDVQISYQEDWVRQHLHALETAYSSSPYFEHYIFDIKPVYEKKPERLVEFTHELHQIIVKSLSLETPSLQSISYDLNPNETDLRTLDEIPSHEVAYRYTQVFGENNAFLGNLSIVDALFNVGPMARNILH